MIEEYCPSGRYFHRKMLGADGGDGVEMGARQRNSLNSAWATNSIDTNVAVEAARWAALCYVPVVRAFMIDV